MRPVLSDDEAAALAREVLDVDRVALEPIAVGYGNVSWRVESDRGRFVLKVGPRESAAKWASGRVGMGLATKVGVPTQRAVHFSVRDDRVVRAFEWVDGTMARSLHDRPDAQARLGADLGRAIATLHAVPRVSYSSRLEGSAPTFARWDEYVHHRLAQIGARVRATASVDEATLARASALASTVAGEVTDSARMTLCHRDLHPDNLVVDEDGALLAILDWDMAEVWDQAGEWFKLDWMLFTGAAGVPERLRGRVRRHPPGPPGVGTTGPGRRRARVAQRRRQRRVRGLGLLRRRRPRAPRPPPRRPLTRGRPERSRCLPVENVRHHLESWSEVSTNVVDVDPSVPPHRHLT